MLDVAIVGGGLCGLLVANLLAPSKRSFAVFEGRARLGGRVHTLRAQNGAVLDLGPTWIWPEENPTIEALCSLLELELFRQPAEGRITLQKGATSVPVPMSARSPHGDAVRLRGGASSLIEGLAARLSQEKVHLETELYQARYLGSHWELEFSKPAGPERHLAQRLVLALPPRVALRTIRFDPPLPPEVHGALRDRATWMAGRAKAFFTYDDPKWRDYGDSGSAFSEEGILGEVFDATEPDGPAALGAFLNPEAETRGVGEKELRSRAGEHIAKLFPYLKDRARQLEVFDWGQERFTSTPADDCPQELTAPPPILTLPHFQGRLFFGGTETAHRNAGHLEGAATRAFEIHSALVLPVPQAIPVGSEPVDDSLAEEWQELREWIEPPREKVLLAYRDALSKEMTGARSHRITQRACLTVAEAHYEKMLRGLVRFAKQTPAAKPLLEGELLVTLAAYKERLLALAIEFNRSSCALNKFPAEVEMDPESVREIHAELSLLFEEFQKGLMQIVATATLPKPRAEMHA